MKIYIDNEEVLCDKEIIIKEELLNTSSTILKNCYPKSWETTKDYTQWYFPKDYSVCKIYDSNNNLIFCGVAKNTGNVSLNPREPHYVDIQILDFKTFLSEGETLDYVITNQTVTQAITTVVNSISDYGFVVGNIEIVDDTTIGAYSTLDKTPYDVFQYFANITGTRWFTRMIDDQTVAIDFYDPSMLNQGINIEYTKEFFETNDIIDMKFNYSTRDYRNKQIIKSNQVFGGVDYTETFIADGASDTYILSANVGKIVSIKIGNSNLTFTTKENRELGYTADVYYSFGQNSLITENIFLQGAVMQVTYTPLVEGRQVVFNANEVNRIKNSTGRKGVIARYETRNDTVDSNELYLIGKSYIRYKGTSEITLTVKSRQNLWNIGDVVYFDAPINELDKSYMVKGKTIERLPLNNVIFYTYEMTSSYNDEKSINYFDNQRAKNSGNIGEGQFIKRNIDIPNEVIIVFDNLQVEEVV
jgi:hypothetical protein